MSKEIDFERFYKENYKALFLQAYYIIGDEEACRDLVADCFEYSWTHFGDMPLHNWVAYIRQMLKNRCIDYIRKVEVKEKYLEFYKIVADVADEGVTDDRLQKIYAVVDKMKPPTGTILKEVFFRKKRYKEVAVAMNISTSTVKKHIIKALKEIRSAVKS
ncbi:MAG: sigma-70 family RNA polymerase sigma factor [Prevotella sp.]